MRIALISDLHGNAVALEAVLAHADRMGVDETICLGDVATLGPRPREVVGMLRDRGCRCILGNHDSFMLDPELIRSYTDVPIVVDSVDWCRERLQAHDLAFLAGFVDTLELPLDAGTRALLFHGSPSSNTQDLLATTSPDELDRHLGGAVADVMAGGHTHIAMMRQHRGILLVNPGSVGMPFREYADGRAPEVMRWAEYATVEASAGSVQVTLHRVGVDVDRMRRECEASDNPICRALAVQYA